MNTHSPVTVLFDLQVWARITTSRLVVDSIDSWTAKLRNVRQYNKLRSNIEALVKSEI